MEVAVGVHMLEREKQSGSARLCNQLKTLPSLLQPISVSPRIHAFTSPNHDYVDRDFITCPVNVI